jgi:hypothetical protein
LWEPSSLSSRGPCCHLLIGLEQAVLPESKNMRKRMTGLSKNLGGLVVSSANSRKELLGYQLQAWAVALVRRGAKSTSATEVPPSEGNEARWDGRQEIVTF